MLSTSVDLQDLFIMSNLTHNITSVVNNTNRWEARRNVCPEKRSPQYQERGRTGKWHSLKSRRFKFKSTFKTIKTENNSPMFAVSVALCATARWTRQAAMIVDCSISMLWVKGKGGFIDAPRECKYL